MIIIVIFSVGFVAVGNYDNHYSSHNIFNNHIFIITIFTVSLFTIIAIITCITLNTSITLITVITNGSRILRVHGYF